MKKAIVIMAAAGIGLIGTAPAAAQDGNTTTTLIPGTPELCAEADTRPDNVDCEVVFPGEENPYPPAVAPPTEPPPTVAPPTDPPATDPPTTDPPPQVAPPTVPAAPLPSTGSSGTTGVLQVGALLVTGGLLALVAARRRSTAQATAS